MRQGNVDPLGTLSAGNVITASITLLKSNFSSYFLLSARSTGWLLVGFIGYFLLTIGSLLVAIQFNAVWLIFVAFLLSMGGLFFCIGKCMANRAMISRLAYQQLIDRPETVREVSAALGNSQWKFFGFSLWLTLFGSVAFSIIFLILLVGIGLGVYFYGQSQGFVGFFIAFILIAGSVIGSLWVLLRYSVGVSVAELPMAVENKPSLDSINRSWQLTSPYVRRIMLILFVASLVTIPPSMISNVPTQLISDSQMEEIFKSITNSTFAENATVKYAGFLFGLSLLLSIIVDAFLVPFWQAVKSVIYFDLRSRREGNDLRMRS
jgi:hypothetical protein